MSFAKSSIDSFGYCELAILIFGFRVRLFIGLFFISAAYEKCFNLFHIDKKNALPALIEICLNFLLLKNKYF